MAGFLRHRRASLKTGYSTQNHSSPQASQLEDAHEHLRRLCLLPPNRSNGQERGPPISEKRVREMQVFLEILDEGARRYGTDRWSLRPRLYGILLNIRAVASFMDQFISHQYTDFWLPFTQQTLPPFLKDQPTRDKFFDIQESFLTYTKDIESGNRHRNLSESGDNYFTPLRILGQGSFGAVDLVLSRLSLARFARKRVLRGRSPASMQSQNYLIRELQELRKLDHRHLVSIWGSYTDKEYIAYIMTPVAECTLELFLSSSRPLRQHEQVMLRQFYGCLAGAVNYLHGQRIRHRDLTPRNILLFKNKVFVSDFGSAYNWAEQPGSQTRHRSPPVSQDYMAPEISQQKERGQPSDMWSLGVVFLEMTTKLLGKRVSDFKNRLKQHSKRTGMVVAHPYANLPAVFEWMGMLGTGDTSLEHDCEPLEWVRELLHERPEHRLTAKQLMKDISDSSSLNLFRCLQCQPSFQDDAFAYGDPTSASRDDFERASQSTRDKVEALFDHSADATDLPFGEFLNSKRSSSIETWLSDTVGNPRRESSTTADSDTPPRLPGAWESDSGATGFFSTYTDQMLYGGSDGYEHMDEPESPDGEIEDLVPTARVLPTAPQGFDQNAFPRTGRLQDSGTGFQEFESNPSYPDPDRQPFDEISDACDSDSDTSMPVPVLSDCVKPPAGDDHAINSTNAASSRVCLAAILTFGPSDGFLEETDDSESEPEVVASTPMPMQLLTAPKALRLKDQGQTKETQDEVQAKSEDQEKAGKETRENLPKVEVQEQETPGRETQGKEAVEKEAQEKEAPRKSALKKDKGAQVGEEKSVGTKTHQMPRPDTPLIAASRQAVVSMSAARPDSSEECPAETTDAVSQAKTTAKKARFSEETIALANKKDQDRSIPKVVSEEAGAGAAPKGKTPRVVKKREALLSVNASKLMAETWDKASRSAMSTMSDNSKSRLHSLLLRLQSRPLQEALEDFCKTGQPSRAQLVLEHATRKNRKMCYRKPMVRAVQGDTKQHYHCVRVLIDAGASAESRSRSSSKTVLHIALENAESRVYARMVHVLLAAGADPNREDPNREAPLAKLFYGNDSKPLTQGRRDALVMLLKAGAKPNLVLPGTGNTPLHQAVRRLDEVAVAVLLHAGARVDVANAAGSTPLLLAAAQFRGELGSSHAMVLNHLLRAAGGASVVDRAVGAQGRTALHRAVVAGCAQAVEMLLAARASPTIPDKEGNDAVMLAIQNAGRLTTPAPQNRTTKGQCQQPFGWGRNDAPQERVAGGALAAADLDARIEAHMEIMLRLSDATGAAWPTDQGMCVVEVACKRKDTELLKQLLDKKLNPEEKFGHRSVWDMVKERGSFESMHIIQCHVIEELQRLRTGEAPPIT